MYTVGSRLALARKKCKITQDEMAEKIGVAKMTISNFENDKSNISVSQILQFAHILNVSVTYLITGHEEVDKNITLDAYSFFPPKFNISGVPLITDSLKMSLNQIVDIVAEGVFKKELSELEFYVGDDVNFISHIVQEIVALSRQNAIINQEKIKQLKNARIEEIKTFFKIDSLLQNWVKIIASVA